MNEKEWHMSPVYIEILLHIYCHGEPLESNDKSSSELGTMIKDNLVKEDASRSSGYTLTARGDKLVHMICETPLPVYTDPRIK